VNHEEAADLRSVLNAKSYVRGPEDDEAQYIFRLARVRQPGYLNGDPLYEVLIDATDAKTLQLPSDFLELVTDRGCYLRVDEGTVHIRSGEI